MLAEAVEDLARALGLWKSDEGAGIVGSFRFNGRYIVRMRPGPDDHELAPLEAMIWLRCYMLGATRERCPDCEGALVERRRDLLSDLEWLDGEGGWVPLSGPLEFGYHRIWVRPCPTCTGPAVECSNCKDEPACGECGFTRWIPGKPTGWVTLAHGWAERWLRARPQECERCPECDDEGSCFCDICDGHVTAEDAERPLIWPGDPEARADLTTLADEQLSKGDPLGLWLSLWLAGVPCGGCEGLGADIGEHGNPHEQDDCEPCHGSGLELGHHSTAMAEAVARLAEDLERAELK